MHSPATSFRILPRRHQREDGGWRVEFAIHAGERHQLVTYDFPASLGEPETDDAVVPMGLFAAMAHGLPFVVEHPVDARLAEEAMIAMDIAAEWWADALVAVPLDLPVRPATPAAPGRGRAAFFTGGLDSWHTLMRHEQEITHLVYVHGFDLPSQSADEHAAVGRRVREAAAARGFTLHEIHTNHRDLGEHLVGDFQYSHGAMLAAVALMLAKSIERVYVASSNHYSEVMPWGSTWMLDPLWSTGNVLITYDGADVWRSAKALEFVKSPDLLAHLIVCPEGYAKGKNCGHCEKCQRTMQALHFAGIDDLSTAFARDLDPQEIAAMRFASDWNLDVYARNLELGMAFRPDSPIIKALQTCVRENHARQLLRDLAALGDAPIEPGLSAKLLRGMRDPLWALWSATAPKWLEHKLAGFVQSHPARAMRALWS